jgi:hypothetical protein
MNIMAEPEVSSARVPHPIERALERYGVILTRDTLAGLEQAIDERKGVCLHKTPQAELVLIGYEGTALVAVWDLEVHCIRTFLPREVATNHRLRHRFIRQELANQTEIRHLNGTRLKKMSRQIERRENKKNKHTRQHHNDEGE